MAKFYGEVGYAISTETAPGVWVDEIVERNYRGDILQDQRRWQPADQVNDNINVDNKVSIMADPYMYENLDTIRYVSLYGTKWKVKTITILRPRIDRYLGGVYNE